MLHDFKLNTSEDGLDNGVPTARGRDAAPQTA
jgi:hypothetical protein